MAEIAFLHFSPGNSLLHKIPGWIKLLLLISLSIALGFLNFISLVVAAMILLVSSFIGRPSLLRMKGAIAFAIIMALFTMYGEYNTGGNSPLIYLKGARFILIFWLGIVFTSVSDPTEVGNSFYILTRWIPFFPAKRLRTLITLTLAFLPLIMDESKTVELAARSRCFNKRRNPVTRMRYRVEPLLEGVLRKSEEISQAMAARCYKE